MEVQGGFRVMKDHRHVEPVAVDEYGSLVLKWYCDPPAVGTRYAVVKDAWARPDGRHFPGPPFPLRRVYEWASRGRDIPPPGTNMDEYYYYGIVYTRDRSHVRSPAR